MTTLVFTLVIYIFGHDVTFMIQWLLLFILPFSVRELFHDPYGFRVATKPRVTSQEPGGYSQTAGGLSNKCLLPERVVEHRTE